MVIVLAGIAGIFTWSLLEYVIHRWLGHDVRTRPNPFAAEHVRHHSEGNYFAPTSKKLLIVGLTLVLLWIPATTLFGAVGAAYAGGFVGMYALYEVVHRRDHTHPGWGRYGKFLRRHHFHHHFEDPASNHGVTSPIWDWAFGTFQAAEVIRVPRKLAMPWLLDPASGEVRAAHSDHYRVYGRA